MIEAWTRYSPAHFWYDQWGGVMSAPWVIIPLLLIAAFIGWKMKGSNDDGEIRGLRAQKDAAESRLELAHDKYDRGLEQVQELKARLVLQDQVFEEIKSPPHGVDFREHLRENLHSLSTGNNEIQSVLSSLTSSTADLGATLGPSAGAVYSDTPQVIKLTKGSG
jgi:hypothetical protein